MFHAIFTMVRAILGFIERLMLLVNLTTYAKTMYTITNRTVYAVIVAIALAASVFAAFPISYAKAQTTACSFTRDLYVGVTAGEDVRCLQRYLNGAGFTIAASGVGAPGSETTIFGELTRKAAVRWQTAQGISPATGTWGPGSRAKYAAVKGGGTVVVPTPTTPTIPSTTDETRARTAIVDAMTAYDDASDEGADESDLEDVRSNLFAAMRAFMNRSYTQSIALANDAQNDADDLAGNSDDDDDDNGSSGADENDAEDAIEDAQNAIDDAQEALDESTAGGGDRKDAGNLIEDAEEALADAEDALDDEDYDDAVDLAEEAIDLAEEAEDLAKGDDADYDEDEDGANDAIDDANDALDDAEDTINDSDASSSKINRAEDMLDEANDLIEEAEDAFDDEDWEEAIDKALEAMELIEEAEDLVS